ncbi:MAG: radical SAM protein [Deltaproteobacteria bacterium]|nr:radical SAM protein [Deltaproteobacteria bacterium]
MDRRVRLHVMVSHRCSNRCVFCLEDEQERADADFGDPFAILEAFEYRDTVLFTCGEPTLSPILDDLVRRADELGYHEVDLVTNGRLLADGRRATRLVQAGLTGVTVSIHSHRPELHNQLTRRRSFLQTLGGLRNMLALRGAAGSADLVVRTSTVACRPNLEDLPETILFLDRLGVDVINVNFVEPAGRAAAQFDDLVPRMSDVARSLDGVRDRLSCRELVVTGLPACLLRHGAESGTAMAGMREVIWMWQGGTFVQLVPNRTQEYGPMCDTCPARPSCDGVWIRYVERFGWDEFGW